jgi:hypothetical protein
MFMDAAQGSGARIQRQETRQRQEIRLFIAIRPCFGPRLTLENAFCFSIEAGFVAVQFCLAAPERLPTMPAHERLPRLPIHLCRPVVASFPRSFGG